jgi:Tol biopolymer transport system component
MSLAFGSRLGPYEILSALGSGGMGEVYRARDGRLGRDVALKIVPENVVQRPERLARFQREAQAAGALSHSNILAVHDSGVHEGRPYVVYELLEGATLRVRLASEGRLPVRKALELARQIAHGLDAAHGKGIVHRDLKPENLFITRDGVVKILDFGLAKRENESDDGPQAARVEVATTVSDAAFHTRDGAVVGTVGYMSPEQVRAGAVDHRSDVFALGVVLFEMLSGHTPFQRPHAAETMAAILAADPPDLASVDPPVPGAVASLVGRCLEKQPADRFQSCRDLGFAIEVALAHAGNGPNAPRPARSANVAWLAVVALLGIAGVAATAWSLRPSPRLVLVPRQITTGPGWAAEPALSPDGSLVAFVSTRGSGADLWVTDVKGGEPLRLTDDAAVEHSPDWFPDGSALAYVSDRGGDAGIWRVARLGGPPVLLLPNALDPAVSPDGRRLAFARESPSGYRRIAVADLQEAARPWHYLESDEGLWHHGRPAWSPDGTRLCYTDGRDLWTVPISGGRSWRLTTDHAGDARPAFSADGRWVYFASKREGVLALWRVRATGGVPERFTLGSGPETDPHLARSAERLAYSTFRANTGVVIEDRRTGERQRIPDDAQDGGPALTPDGSGVVFSSLRDGRPDLWLRPLREGRSFGAARRITDEPGDKNLPAVSPDGRWIAFGRVLARQRDIWVVPSAGGPSQQITADPAIEMHPAWSPDGGRLAFVSDRDGTDHVWVVAVRDGRPAGTPIRVGDGPRGQYRPAWTPEGDAVAYTQNTGEGREVWLAPADGSAPPRRLAARCSAYMLRRDVLPHSLLVSAFWGGDGLSIRRLDVRSGRSTPLDPPVELQRDDPFGHFDLAAAGRWLLTTEEETRGDVWVLDARDGSLGGR